ncbi:MAG: ankyrin repeat domain-containing protein [Acidobacteria bacterium]|nr:ankyrin repeat domain-containing protein [Acidobacteriota bacterium]
MTGRSTVLAELGGGSGCLRLAEEFYSRVGQTPVLRPLFPGKSLRCATEEFAAFLIQFLGGDDEQTQHRWWLSLRESHARFRISAEQRSAWLQCMQATLDAAGLGVETRQALGRFFVGSSSYVTGKEAAPAGHAELDARWEEQLALDAAIAAITSGDDAEAMQRAARFAGRPSVFTGLLVRMMRSGRAPLAAWVVEAVRRDPRLAETRFAGRTLLHDAAANGCLEVVELLLAIGVDANVTDRGGHTPLYAVANECGAPSGPDVVRALVRAGADSNACGGVTRATPLHMAARRGFVEVAEALLAHGANPSARDKKGDTPLQRARNCRQETMVRLLSRH